LSKGFQSPISNLAIGFSELDFCQNRIKICNFRLKIDNFSSKIAKSCEK
jgi:hypothetical protein